MQDSDSDDITRTHFQLTNDIVIGHYRIIEKIGAGGMGEVYLAEDTKLDRKVALKFLPLHLCQDPECRARFTREAQAAAKLSHPNIVTIYEVSEFNGRPLIAMEHLDGKTLRDLIKQKDIPQDQAIHIGIQLSQGLQEAHHAGIIHRDIKPSNVIVDGKGRCKILDFGLAAVHGGEHLTKTGSTLGTVGYMSPEQARGERADVRSDLFSLGVVLYELVTGRAPFAGESEAATLKNVVDKEPEPMARYKANVPDDLQRIVSKALTKDVALRYQTAADMLADLKRLVLDTKPTKRSTLRRWVAGAAIVVIAVCSYFIGASILKTDLATPDGWTNSVAVLVFRDLSPAKDQDYFCEGMTDEIIGRLSAIRQLKVTSMQSVLRFKNTAAELKRIGSELGVRNILEGSIQRDKDSIRVSAQLIRVNDDAHIWSDRYYHEASGVFAIQDDIAHAIANVLEATLVGEGRTFTSRKGTDNFEAYNAYMQGRFFWRKRTAKDLWAAVRHFENAIALDPRYALAYSGLGDAWLALPNYGRVNHGEAYPIVDSVSRRAVDLDHNSAEAHATRGNYLRNVGDYPGADREFLRALELNPGYSWGHVWYELLLYSRGEREEGAKHLQLAYELDPLSVVVLNNLAARSLEAGDPAKVEQYCEQAIAVEHDYKHAYAYLASSHIQLRHDTAKGLKILEGLTEELPDDWYPWAKKADWLAAIGRSEDAHKAYLRAVEIAPDFWEPHLSLGNFLMNQGRLQEAVTELKRATNLGAGRVDPFLSYARLLAQLGRTSEALEVNRHAVEIAPYDAESNRAYGWLLGVYQLRYDDAIKHMIRATELNPRLTPAYNSLSLMYAYKEDFPKALGAINKSIELLPTDPYPLQRKAYIFTIAGMLDSAVVWYQKYRDRQPNQTLAAIQLQRIYTITGQYAKADSAIASVLTHSDPAKRASGRYYSINSLLHQGRFRDALLASQKNVDLDWAEPRNYELLALEYTRQCEILLLFQHDPKAASAVIQKFGQIPQQSPNATIWDTAAFKCLKAVAEAAAGNIQPAASTLQKELNHANPDDHSLVQEYQYHLALVWRLAGDFRQSASLLEKATAIDPIFCNRLYLGVSYLHLGRIEDAMAVLEKAMSRYDDNRLMSVAESVTGHYYLGQAYEAAARTQDAIAQYGTFLDIWKDADSGLKELDDARARLVRLKGKS